MRDNFKKKFLDFPEKVLTGKVIILTLGVENDLVSFIVELQT